MSLALLLPVAACSSTSFPPSDGPADTQPGDTSITAGAPIDNAAITASSFPDTLTPGESATGTVTVENQGNTTWTAADGYKLGAAGDSDPLYTSDIRLPLSDQDAVPPGHSHTFLVPLVAPSTAGTYTTDWQMVHEAVTWFGDIASHDVAVGDPDTQPVDTGSDNGGGGDTGTSPPLDLASAIVMNSPPDATTWPETATITTLDFNNTDGVYIDFTKRDGDDSWPDVPFGAPGDSLEYTLWIAINVDGVWYTSGCIEYWHGLERNGGPPSGFAANWYYDASRWGYMTGHQPAVGEQVGFFLTAGDARNRRDDSGSIVLERTNVVTIPFPSDAGETYTY